MTKKLKGYGTFDVVLIVILVIVSFACVYPFWYVFANSFASYNVASRGAVAWWPSELSLDGYHAVLKINIWFPASRSRCSAQSWRHRHTSCLPRLFLMR